MMKIGSINGLKIPRFPTLKKYGLSTQRWLEIAKSQGFVCAVCGKLPKTGNLCIDHEHVKGWSKKSDEDRARYVRGLLCYMCNRFYCGRGITVEKARGVSDYLTRYEQRRLNGSR